MSKFQNFGFAIPIKIEFSLRKRKNRFSRREGKTIKWWQQFLILFNKRGSYYNPKTSNCQSYDVIPQFEGLSSISTQQYDK